MANCVEKRDKSRDIVADSEKIKANDAKECRVRQLAQLQSKETFGTETLDSALPVLASIPSTGPLR